MFRRVKGAPYPECWILVNLQAATENSSLSALLDFILKNKKNLNLSLYLSLLPLLACTYLNNDWDLVLRALPLSDCLFKMNRFMYSPIVSRLDKSICQMTKCKCNVLYHLILFHFGWFRVFLFGKLCGAANVSDPKPLFPLVNTYQRGLTSAALFHICFTGMFWSFTSSRFVSLWSF